MLTKDLFESVTNRIIAELEAGNPPIWIRPWKSTKTGGIMPRNFVTGRSYSGANVLLLWAEREEKQYAASQWLTFKQCQAKGGHIRKGEKATPVVFAKKVTVVEADEEKHIPMLRVYWVFNVAQCDGIVPFEAEPELPQETRYANAHVLIKASGAHIEHGGDKAYYLPSQDFIAMPPRSTFKDEENYLATTLHELTHWSGAGHRLNRDLSRRFGTEEYAGEELVAEIGAAFLCAHLGITGELRHSGYIQGWLKVLKNDNRAIFSAASKAQQAANYLAAYEVEEVAEAA